MKKLLLIVFTLLTLGLMSSCDDKQSTDSDDILSSFEGTMWVFDKREYGFDGDWFEVEDDEEYQYRLSKIYFSQGNATAYFKDGKTGVYSYSYIDGYLNIKGMNLAWGSRYDGPHSDPNEVSTSKILTLNDNTFVVQIGERTKWEGDNNYDSTAEFQNHTIYLPSINHGYYIVNGVAYECLRVHDNYVDQFYDIMRVSFKPNE